MAEIRTYRPGDKIRIALNLYDPSGVGQVRAAFANKAESTNQIYLQGNGNNKVRTEVVLETVVTEQMAPGDYWCFELFLEDGKQNRTYVQNPGIEFRIEGVTGADYEGPELKGWRYG